jgi:hypothetical protein
MWSLILSWVLGAPVGPCVAAEAGYALLNVDLPIEECCGTCKNGTITHADGHKTPCPCPSSCACKKRAGK